MQEWNKKTTEHLTLSSEKDNFKNQINNSM